MNRRLIFLTLTIFLLATLACNLSLPGLPVTPTATPTATPLPLPPAIVETDPPIGSEIALQVPLTIYFSEPMDRPSVEAAFTSPNVSQFLFNWLDDATLSVTPAQPLPGDAEISFVLGTGAKTARNGLNLLREVTLAYRTAGLLRVSQVLPAPQAEAVSPASAVVASFNQPVVPLGADSASLPAGFSLEPAADGKGEWLNTSTYIFYPAPGLSGGVDYTVRVNPALKSTAGTALDASAPNMAWGFRTALPEVLDISPNMSSQLDLDPEITVTFNQPMDTASVESNFSLRGPDGSTVPGQFEWNESGSELVFSATGALLPRQTVFTLTVGQASRSRGGAALSRDLQSEYATYAPFAFNGANLADGGLRRSDEGLQLYFSAPLNVPKGQDLTSLLKLSPESPYFGATLEGTTISIFGGLKAGQLYTLTLPASLADKWGQTLGQDVQFTFREPDARPTLNYTSFAQEFFTRPDDPVLSVQAVNLNTLIVSRGTMTLDDYLRFDSDYSFRQGFVPLDNETWTLRPDLPRNDNQAVAVSLSEGPLTPGFYVVNVDSPDLEFRGNNLRALMASNLNVTVKASATEVLVWAVDLRSKAPVSFTTVRVYDEKGGRIANGETDANGLWRGAIPEGTNVHTVVVSQPGEDQFGVGSPNWNLGIASWDFGLSSNTSGPRLMAYLYTERPIYRPGDTVSYRGVLRSQYDGRYSPASLSEVTARLSDFNDGSVIAEQRLALSSYGTLAGQFKLPDGLAPGGYSLSIDAGQQDWLAGGSITIQVADYRKPEINLSVELEPNPAMSGNRLTGQVRAEYFFGAPAADLPFKWTLYSRRDYFSIPEFSTGVYTSNWLSFKGNFGSTYQSGEGVTDENGNFSIPIDDYQTDLLSELTLEITATESGGFPVSARGTLMVHPDAFYIGVRPSLWFGQAGTPLNFDLLTVDWSQKPVAQSLKVDFQQVRWEREDLDYTYNFKPVFTPLESKSVTTGADGSGNVSFTPSTAGTYALEVTSGNARTLILLWVGGSENAAWPNLPYDQLRLTADKENYQPGDAAEVFVPNPFDQAALALLTTERGTFKSVQIVTVPIDGYRFKLPITDAEAPGDTLTLDLTVTNREGQPVQGEFSMSVVDLAVLALAEPNSIDILPAYYDIQPLGVRTGLTEAIYTRRVLNFGGGRGGGGGDGVMTIREDFPDTAYWKADIITDAQGKARITLTLPDSLTTWQVESRGLTQDTRVGQARVRVVTGKDLLIRPQTPRFLVVGDHAELAAIVNNTTNQEQQANVSLTVTGLSLDANVQAEQKVTVPANGRIRVAWSGLVQAGEAVEALFAVKAGSLEDAARPNDGKIPVLRYTAPQTFSTSGILAEANSTQTEIIALPRSFQPLGGQLDLELSPSLASSILTALEARELPEQVWSSEQILSYLLPNTATYLSLQSAGIDNATLRARLDENVQAETGRLLAAQREDGGWPWVLGGAESDTFLTAYIVYGLEQVRQSGLAGDDAVLLEAIQRGRDYLFGYAEPFTGAADLTNPFWANRTAFYCYVLQETGSLNNFGYLADQLYEERERLDPWAKALLAATLSRFNPSDERVNTLFSDLEATALRSATGAHWESSQDDWLTPGSPLYTSALVIYTLSERDPASPLAAEAARYLAAQRGPKGWWASDYENAWIVLALNRFMVATGEYRADFAFSASLNGVKITQGQAAGPQNLTTVSSSTPLTQMMLNGANQLILSHEAGTGKLYYRAALSVDRPVETAPAVNQGIAISREFLQCVGKDCQPVTSYQMKPDESGRVTVRLNVTIPNEVYYFLVEDYIPAGSDLLDPSLKTSQQGEESQEVSIQFDESNPFGEGWGWWYFNRPQIYSDHIQWSADYLPAGTYVLTYTIIPSLAGEYRVLPAHAWLAYFPEVQGTTAGAIFTIKP